nr:PREDICTED: mucin-4-like isoform X1 [Bemisia tabaci]
MAPLHSMQQITAKEPQQSQLSQQQQQSPQQQQQQQLPQPPQQSLAPLQSSAFQQQTAQLNSFPQTLQNFKKNSVFVMSSTENTQITSSVNNFSRQEILPSGESAESSCSSLSSIGDGTEYNNANVPNNRTFVVNFNNSNSSNVKSSSAFGQIKSANSPPYSGVSVVKVSEPVGGATSRITQLNYNIVTINGVPTISVPHGWKRLNANGTIIYVSPSNTALSTLEQVKTYLQTQGTCKCGLECPIRCDLVFNFDSKICSRPASYKVLPSSLSDLTNLCNHKRKSMSSSASSSSMQAYTLPLQPGAQQPNFDAAGLRRKKRRTGVGSFGSGNVSAQLSADRERLTKESSSSHQMQDWNESVLASAQLSTNSIIGNNLNRLPINYQQSNAPVMNPSQQYIRFNSPSPSGIRPGEQSASNQLIINEDTNSNAPFQNAVYQSFCSTNPTPIGVNACAQSSALQRIANDFPNQEGSGSSQVVDCAQNQHHPVSVGVKSPLSQQQLQLLHQQQLQQQQLQQQLQQQQLQQHLQQQLQHQSQQQQIQEQNQQQKLQLQQIQQQQLLQQFQIRNNYQALQQRQVEELGSKNVNNTSSESCSISQSPIQPTQLNPNLESSSKPLVMNTVETLAKSHPKICSSEDPMAIKSELSSSPSVLISNEINHLPNVGTSPFPTNQSNQFQNCNPSLLQSQHIVNTPLITNNQQMNQQSILIPNQNQTVAQHNIVDRSSCQPQINQNNSLPIQNQPSSQHNLILPSHMYPANQQSITVNAQNQILNQQNVLAVNTNQSLSQQNLIGLNQSQVGSQQNLISSNQNHQNVILSNNQNQALSHLSSNITSQDQLLTQQNLMSLSQNQNLVNGNNTTLLQNHNVLSSNSASGFSSQSGNQVDLVNSENNFIRQNASTLQNQQLLAANLVQQRLNQTQMMNQHSFNVNNLSSDQTSLLRQITQNPSQNMVSLHNSGSQIPATKLDLQSPGMSSLIQQDSACSTGSPINSQISLNESVPHSTPNTATIYANHQIPNSPIMVQNSVGLSNAAVAINSSNDCQSIAPSNNVDNQRSTPDANMLHTNDLSRSLSSNPNVNAGNTSSSNISLSNINVIQNQVGSNQNQITLTNPLALSQQVNAVVSLTKNSNPNVMQLQNHNMEQNISSQPGNSGIRQRSIPPWQQNRINALSQQLQVQPSPLEVAQQSANQVQWNDENITFKKATLVKHPTKSPPNPQIAKKPRPVIDSQQHQAMPPNISDRFSPSTSAAPSFMDDPSGYLAQQTALLNSTISRQTGLLSFNCDTPNMQLTSNRNATNPGSKNAGSSQGSDSTFVSFPDSSVNLSNRKFLESQNSNQVGCDRSSTATNELSQQPVTSSSIRTSGTLNSLQNSLDPCSPVQGGTVSTSIQSPIQSERCVTDANPVLPLVPNVETKDAKNESDTKEENSRPTGSRLPTVVTTMASGHTVSSNTITSVLAGRTNTATVSINAPASNSSPVIPSIITTNFTTTMTATSCPSVTAATKSPLEMVQSVVSSIQIPSSTSQNSNSNETKMQTQPTSHILVSSNGHFIVASSSNQNLPKAHQPSNQVPSIVSQANSSITQVLPLNVGSQQVLNQPTVLVNNFSPLLFQQGLINVDGTVNAVQIPQLTVATNNVLQANQLIDECRSNNGQFSPRQHTLLSPDSLNNKRKNLNKKRKVAAPTVASMLQIASQQNPPGSQIGNIPGSMMTVQQAQPQPSFSTQQTAPMLQTLILPNKNGQFTNGQPMIATANVLQPLNLVPNFPTIQQFIVPTALGGMVMTASDGTATLLQDGLHLNVLTPVQNHTGAVFNNSQNILAASPAGMVLRAPTVQTSSGKLQIQTTPNGQLIATNSPNQFIVGGGSNNAFAGQLSPIVASVSPSHSFASPNGNNCNQRQEFIQCITSGPRTPTLMVPCSITPQQCSPQNTTVVQRNTTIVQQQMTMVSNNNQQNVLENQQNQASNLNQQNLQILHSDQGKSNHGNPVIITTDKNNSSFILSPKTASDKSTHYIIHQSNVNDKPGASQSQPSFIISNAAPDDDKSVCGNFLLSSTSSHSDKLSSQNKIILNAGTGQNNIILDPKRQQQNNFLKQSVSTQTASTNTINQQNSSSNVSTNLVVATNNTFSQTSSTPFYSVSPPDTTTHSPIDSNTAPSPGSTSGKPETPSSSVNIGSLDENNLSPTSTTIPTSLSDSKNYQTQPMVHYVSSSNEQEIPSDWSDSSANNQTWTENKYLNNLNTLFLSAAPSSTASSQEHRFSRGLGSEKSPINSAHVESSSSTSPVQSYDSISSHHSSKNNTRNYMFERKITNLQQNPSSMDHRVSTMTADEGNNDSDADSTSELEVEGETKLLGLSEGDLVWGAARGFPSWPGKLVGPAPTPGRVWVRWFGGPNSAQLSEVEPKTLKTLSEGLEAHHRACKKFRKSRKLNSQLENAIQEAMAELDRMSETPEQGAPLPPVNATPRRHR